MIRHLDCHKIDQRTSIAILREEGMKTSVPVGTSVRFSVHTTQNFIRVNIV